MRTVGIGILGLIGGLLFAIVLQDVLHPVFGDNDDAPTGLGVGLGSMLGVFGLAGATLAVWLDRRNHSMRSGRSKDSTDA